MVSFLNHTADKSLSQKKILMNSGHNLNLAWLSVSSYLCSLITSLPRSYTMFHKGDMDFRVFVLLHRLLFLSRISLLLKVTESLSFSMSFDAMNT